MTTSISTLRKARTNHRRGGGQWGSKIVLSLFALVGLAPFLFMLTTSLKSNEELADNYWLFPSNAQWQNYATAFQQIAPYLIASVIVAAVAVLAIIAISSLAGFVLARYSFPGRTFLFGMVLALMMIPGISSLIPMFVMMKDFHLLNTYAVLVIPHVAGGVVLGTILMRTFISEIPQTLFDAARVDGANGARLFRSIMLPLSLPVIGTVGLITVIGVWNDFFWPLLTITDNNLRTVSVGLLFFQGQNVTEYGPMFAGYALASLPLLLLFVFLSKYFLAGIQGGRPGSN